VKFVFHNYFLSYGQAHNLKD